MAAVPICDAVAKAWAKSGSPQVGDSVRESLIEEREIEAEIPEGDSQVIDNQ